MHKTLTFARFGEVMVSSLNPNLLERLIPVPGLEPVTSRFWWKAIVNCFKDFKLLTYFKILETVVAKKQRNHN